MTNVAEIQLPPNSEEPERNSENKNEENNQILQENSVITLDYKVSDWIKFMQHHQVLFYALRLVY